MLTKLYNHQYCIVLVNYILLGKSVLVLKLKFSLEIRRFLNIIDIWLLGNFLNINYMKI